jgi:hypothetical protein
MQPVSCSLFSRFTSGESVDERTYLLEVIFLETEVFALTITESERERLYFDLVQGNGESIEDTGGLKRIRYGPYGHHGRKGCEAVFAEYSCPDLRKRIFLLLNEFPLPLDRTLNEQERKELRQLKAKADRFIERYIEEHQDEE